MSLESGAVEISKIKFKQEINCKKCIDGKFYLSYKCSGCDI